MQQFCRSLCCWCRHSRLPCKSNQRVFQRCLWSGTSFMWLFYSSCLWHVLFLSRIKPVAQNLVAYLKIVFVFGTCHQETWEFVTTLLAESVFGAHIVQKHAVLLYSQCSWGLTATTTGVTTSAVGGVGGWLSHSGSLLWGNRQDVMNRMSEVNWGLSEFAGDARRNASTCVCNIVVILSRFNHGLKFLKISYKFV